MAALADNFGTSYLDSNDAPVPVLESAVHRERSRDSISKPGLETNDSFGDEKKGYNDNVTSIEIHDVTEIYDIASGNPMPENPHAPIETQTLTIRAVLVGCMLGSIVQASNLYLGLKTGFTFGPQLFGAILGFVILKSIHRFTPAFMGGKTFGEKENVVVQTAATAAGGLGIIWVTGIPAMYTLGLLSPLPKQDFGRLITFALSTAFFGMSFAIPLRKWYILKQKLVFPTPTATAVTIRALHSGAAGAAEAKKRAVALGASFGASAVLKILSQYAPGLICQHWGWLLYRMGANNGVGALRLDNWGFSTELTPAFLGAGVLSGVNASLSFYAGTIVAWAIMGPILEATGTCGFRDFSEDYNGYPILNYTKMSFADPKGLVSPRYWMLWVGVLMMVFASFTEIACQGKTLVTGARDVYCEFANTIARRRGQEEKYTMKGEAIDPCPKEDQTPVWGWLSMLVFSTILCIIVCAVQFKMNVGIVILSIIMGFLFSFIGVQCAGNTDINPISTCAKATQVVVGGATHGKYAQVTNPDTGVVSSPNAERINLLGGLIAGAAAAQATDMTGDLRTGHLLRAKPRDQFWAQAAGALCSVFLGAGLFVLFTQAYPCIINPDAATCPFGAPSVAAWAAVAKATTSTDGLPLPTSSAVTALIFALVATAIVVVRNFYVPIKYRQYVVNPVAFGLAFTLPPGYNQYSSAMAVGSLIAWWYKKNKPGLYDVYAFALAAGMCAGEGIGGVINALFVIVKIDGSLYGTALGCPGNVYCG